MKEQKYYVLYKDDKPVVIYDFELQDYLAGGWKLKEGEYPDSETFDAEESDISLEDWTDMLSEIKGTGAKDKFEEIGRSIGVEVDKRKNPISIRRQLIDAYSKKSS